METGTTTSFSLKTQIVDESFTNGMTRRAALLGVLEPGRFSCIVIDQTRQKVVLLKDYRIQDESRQLPDRVLTQILAQDTHLSELETDKVLIGICAPCSVLVPGPLFNKDTAGEVLGLACPVTEKDTISSDTLSLTDAHLVYSIPTTLLESIGDRYKEFSLYHANTAFLRSQLMLNKHQPDALVSVNVRDRYLDIVVTRGSELLFSNSFFYESSEDFIYYLLLVLEQLQLNPDVTETRFYGEIDKTSANWMVSRKYIRNLVLGERPEGIEYSYGFERLNAAQYYVLFCQHLCVS